MSNVSLNYEIRWKGSREGDAMTNWTELQQALEAKGADGVQVGGDHYHGLGIQPWAAMQAWMTHEQFVGFLRGNIVKYAARTGSKGEALEDVRKLAHYAQKLIEVLEAK